VFGYELKPHLTILSKESIYKIQKWVLTFFVNSNFVLNLFNLRLLVTTDTELSAIAAAAKIGLSRIPKNG